MTYEEARQYIIDARYTDKPLDETMWDEAMDAATDALKSKNDLINRVLEIIDASERMAKRIPQKYSEVKALSRGVTVACKYIRIRVLALKGGDAE